MHPMKHFTKFALVLVLSLVGVCWGSCTHPVYCTGPILDAVQRAAIFNDSKTFVDMPMRYPPATIVEIFTSKVNSSSKEELAKFVSDYFLPAGSDLLDVNPVDWQPNPSFLNSLKNPQIKIFAQAVHDKWHALVRAWNDSFCDGCFSHIPVTYPFVIAGSRFREFYYWDSYWTLEGLIVSEMLNTSKGHILNFLDMVQQIGFVPNGGRIYYLNRSQPPLLTQMVAKYFEATNDFDFLEMAVPILDKEYEFWMTNTTVEVANGEYLNRYYVINDLPRPESYLPDVLLAETVPTEYAPVLFQQIATGAETGWDFSSRWMRDQPDLASLQTTEVIPVDLNSILYKNEKTLAFFHDLLKEFKTGDLYRARARKRLAAIQTHLWNDELSIWNDRFLNGTLNTNFYPSNLVPLWAGAFEEMPKEVAQKMLDGIADIFSYPSGVPTSFINTLQQWDFPNGWAPLQYFVITGLNALAAVPGMDSEIAKTCQENALQLASKWITTNYCGWNATGIMFEKYDVNLEGSPGSGGEYTVQDGFGWTNGVVLYLLEEYGNTFTLGSCQL